MILYKLKCANGHNFESWFGSSEIYEKLNKLGQIKCELCDSNSIEKELMSPKVQISSTEKSVGNNLLTKSHSEAEKIFKQFKEKIEKNTENVGRDFAKIARQIHEGNSPERSIIGEATAQETIDLIEDEIPITPLPWINRKTN